MNEPATFAQLEGVIGSLVSAIMGFVAIVLFLMLVSSGFKYITSGGNPEAAAAARRTMTYAVMGILVIASAYLIIVIIHNITGADITNFRLNIPN